MEASRRGSVQKQHHQVGVRRTEDRNESLDPRMYLHDADGAGKLIQRAAL